MTRLDEIKKRLNDNGEIAYFYDDIRWLINEIEQCPRCQAYRDRDFKDQRLMRTNGD